MGIKIDITAGQDVQSSSVVATGEEVHIISDLETNTFGIEDDDLKDAVNKYFGKKPNDAYLHSPTPWNDLYKTYGWDQVELKLTPDTATITGITTVPTIVATETFTNNSSVQGVFNVGISQEVSQTTESSWSQTSTISVSQEVSYGISFLGTGGGGTTGMSFSEEWGKGHSESETITVGSQSGVQVTLDPGQSVKAVLTANRGVMNVRVVYNAVLEGQTAVNYNPTYNGHHFWGLDIGRVMSAANLSDSRSFTEDIKIGYYSDAKIDLQDLQGETISTLSFYDKAGE
jgi:hypothetical protein